MFEQMKNIRKFDFPLDRYDNDPFLKNPLLKYRQNKNRAKRLKRNDKQRALVSKTSISHLLDYFHFSDSITGCFIPFRIAKNSSSIRSVW